MTARPSSRHTNRAITLDLLAQQACSDDAAFEALHRRLTGGLRRYLQRRSGTDETVIEELVHATWVEVWRALRSGTYDPGRARISTFVYAIGHKMVLRYLRSAQRDARRETWTDDSADTTAATAVNLDDLLHTTEMLDALRECTTATESPFALTDEEREIVTRLATGSSERGLATELGLAASTVNARKRTAYRKLQSCLQRKGFRPESVERDPADSE